MNKKIASEIAVGIILLLVILIGGIFYFQNLLGLNNVESNADKKIEVNLSPSVISNTVPPKENPIKEKPVVNIKDASNEKYLQALKKFASDSQDNFLFLKNVHKIAWVESNYIDNNIKSSLYISDLDGNNKDLLLQENFEMKIY